MLKLSGYMDETGHSKDEWQKFNGMAGLIANADKWETFERRWKRALRRFKIPYFHMKEFAHSEGVFKDWKGDETKRRALYGRLLSIISSVDPVPLGAIISMEDFRALPLEHQRMFIDPYFLGFVLCVGIPFRMLVTAPLEVECALVFSKQGEFRKRAMGLYAQFVKIYPSAQRISTPAFRDMRKLMPLQAADIVAYELYKEAERKRYRPQAEPRHGFVELTRMALRTIDMMPFYILSKEALEWQVQDMKQIRKKFGEALFRSDAGGAT